jgi:hypothetical protein
VFRCTPMLSMFVVAPPCERRESDSHTPGRLNPGPPPLSLRPNVSPVPLSALSLVCPFSSTIMDTGTDVKSERY